MASADRQTWPPQETHVAGAPKTPNQDNLSPKPRWFDSWLPTRLKRKWLEIQAAPESKGTAQHRALRVPRRAARKCPQAPWSHKSFHKPNLARTGRARIATAGQRG